LENQSKKSAIIENEGIERPDSISAISVSQIQNSRKIQPSSKDLVKGILNGNIAALSRAITLVESTNVAHLEKANEVINA
jgi:LAO/AO transport system kinase